MDSFDGHAAFADGEDAGAGMESTVRPRGRPRKLVAEVKDARAHFSFLPFSVNTKDFSFPFSLHA